MLNKNWIKLGEGSYNTAYKSIDGTQILKISKNDKILTDTPERSVRLWNLINPSLEPKAKIVTVDGHSGWICPFVEGEQASDDEIVEAVFDIYNKTQRIVTDALAQKNFLKTPQGQVVCVDIGLALLLDRQEQNNLIQILRRPSEVSINAWNDLDIEHDKFFSHPTNVKNYPKTINAIKALLYINSSRPDIYDVSFLKNNQNDIQYYAIAYDASRQVAIVKKPFLTKQHFDLIYDYKTQLHAIRKIVAPVRQDREIYTKAEKHLIMLHHDRLAAILEENIKKLELGSSPKDIEQDNIKNIDNQLTLMLEASKNIPESKRIKGFINQLFILFRREPPFKMISKTTDIVHKIKTELINLRQEGPDSTPSAPENNNHSVK